MKADAWHYELVGSQMGMVVMEHLTPRMVIIHSPPLTSQLPSPVLGGREGERGRNGMVYKEKETDNIHRVQERKGQEGGLFTE